MAKSSVRHFSHNMGGAPVLNAGAGSLRNLLDAILLDGFNQQNPASLTVDADGLATATFASPHGYSHYAWIRIEGADQEVLNDDWQIEVVDSTTVTFVAYPTTVVTATGNFTTRVATPRNVNGYGWTKPFEGADPNLCAYRVAMDPGENSSGLYVRVNDTNSVIVSGNWSWRPHNRTHFGVYAHVHAYESMEDIDTMHGRLELSDERAWIPKAEHTSQTTGSWWWAVADHRVLYLITQHQTSDNGSRRLQLFGDPVALDPADPFVGMCVMGCALFGTSNWDTTHASTQLQYQRFSGNLARVHPLSHGTGRRMTRSRTGAPGAIDTNWVGFYSDWLGHGGFTYPNPCGNQLILNPVFAREGAALRARVPGLYQLVHTVPISPNDGVRKDISTLPGRAVLTLRVCRPHSASFDTNYAVFDAQLLFDITGPWRNDW
jgi:hypothetical protein